MQEPTIYIGFEDGKTKYVAGLKVGKKGYETQQFVEISPKVSKSLFEKQCKKSGYLVQPWKGGKDEKLDRRKNKRMEFTNISA